MDLGRIKGLRFSLLDEETILKLAPHTLKVSSNLERNLEQLQLSLFGENGAMKCSKCDDAIPCPGHCAKLELKYRILHPFVKTEVAKLLMHYCNVCNRFKFNTTCDIAEQDLEEDVVATTQNTSTCICGNAMPLRCTFSVHKERIKRGYVLCSKGGKESALQIPDIYDAINHQRSDIATHLKDPLFDPTRWFPKYLLVNPLAVRPSNVDDLENTLDHVTVAYAHLMCSLANRESITHDRSYISLIYHSYTQFLGLHMSSDGKNKLFKQRIGSKDGLFRKIALARRSNFCARSVIVPDLTIGIHQVGVPEVFRSSLRVKEGEEYRDLKDGDLVLINRQPSLQRTSIIALEAKIVKECYSIRLNPIIVVPLNGDFDGDEISMYSVVNQQAIAEAYSKCYIVNNLLLDYKLVIGLDQNTVLGLHLLSILDEPIDLTLITNMRETMSKYKALSIPIVYNTKFLLTSLLPNITYKRQNITIESGVFISGVITKSSWWTSRNSVLQHMYIVMEDFKTFVDTIRNMQVRVDKWIQKYGLTIGLDECMLPREVTQKILQDFPDEQDIATISAIKQASEKASLKFLEESKHISGLLRCVLSGSKGDRNNIGQINSMVGQQYVFGEKPYMIKHAETADYPRNTGFVTSSYTSGLTPLEMFYHSQMGREGIIRTSISTADTGYTQRTLIKFLEGLNVHEDGTIRDSDGSITRFYYSHGMNDDSKRIPFEEIKDKQLERDIKHTLF